MRFLQMTRLNVLVEQLRKSKKSTNVKYHAVSASMAPKVLYSNISSSNMLNFYSKTNPQMNINPIYVNFRLNDYVSIIWLCYLI